MLLTFVLAIAVPVAFLYVIHWLDLYGTDRPRIVLICFAWGLVAFLLSFAVNRFGIDILGLSRSFVSTRTAPLVEEVFKSLVLIDLVRRAKLVYAVDGAVYGFATGIGFAVIENLRYLQLFPDNPVALVVVRDFSSALGHGTSTAVIGITLGVFAISTPADRRLRSLLPGMAIALTLHYAWNNFAFFSPFDLHTTQWVLVGVGLSGVASVAAAILWGLHRERLLLRESLGIGVRVSEEEASVVQHMDDLHRLLAPIAMRFGHAKCRQVANLLHLEAQVGLAKRGSAQAADPVLRAAMDSQIVTLEDEIDRYRRDVGVYVMLYVRSIFPATEWSLWARLAQTLARGRTLRADVWSLLDSRLGRPAADGDGLYERVQRALDARNDIARGDRSPYCAHASSASTRGDP